MKLRVAKKIADVLESRLAQLAPKPDPRPASELTQELEAWDGQWMIQVSGSWMSGQWEKLPIETGAIYFGPTARFRVGAGLIAELANVQSAYPIQPDMTRGPIPATWLEVDAAVAARKANALKLRA